MSFLKKIIFFFMIIISICTGLAYAQESIIDHKNTSSEKQIIYSQTLQEKRTYQVYLPSTYHDTQLQKTSYPVLYVLDAHIRFEEAITIVNLLHKTYPTIPEMIIVGIYNTDRTRDLTPTKVLASQSDYRNVENSGGAAHFQTFLTQELRNEINKTYRTNGYNILSGHSFGGLFGLNVLLTEPQAFNAYLLADPSIWWDQGKWYQQLMNQWHKIHFKNTNVFIAKANNSVAKKNHFSKQFEGDFCADLKQDKPHNRLLRIDCRNYPEDNHGTVPVPAMIDGLKFVFANKNFSIKRSSTDINALQQAYQQVSHQTGFMFQPQESVLILLEKWLATQQDKNNDLKILLNYHLQLYPKSPYAQKQMNEIQMR
ncbi:alpha/beta hydrolase [Neisseria sp. Ec49-e6-T10]|uniref:alpha/beta hydrolase n=1 Tax=Neisseria sp. Ec49-e6-T10 TaxID=3140744 RepID=UPI003EBC742A